MYKHTQIGWVIIIAVAIMMVFLPFVLPRGRGFDTSIFLGLAAVILIYFSTLTVEVNEEVIKISFGAGLIKRKFMRKDIVSYKVIRNKWWCCSWGIHGWPGKGWLYNVSGLDVIELTMKNGMRYLIGTDEPVALYGAVKNITSGEGL